MTTHKDPALDDDWQPAYDVEDDATTRPTTLSTSGATTPRRPTATGTSRPAMH